MFHLNNIKRKAKLFIKWDSTFKTWLNTCEEKNLCYLKFFDERHSHSQSWTCHEYDMNIKCTSREHNMMSHCLTWRSPSHSRWHRAWPGGRWERRRWCQRRSRPRRRWLRWRRCSGPPSSLSPRPSPCLLRSLCQCPPGRNILQLIGMMIWNNNFGFEWDNRS